MKRFFTRNTIWLSIAAASLIFAIRFFEAGFHAGQVSTKIYITIIGIIFLGVGAYTALQFSKPRPVLADNKAEDHLSVDPNDLLTERECGILKCIARGLTNKQIGEQLFVSENTVKKHLNNIYFKLDVNRRTQAVARARELRILTG